MLAYLSKQEEQVGKAGREEKQRELGGAEKEGVVGEEPRSQETKRSE